MPRTSKRCDVCKARKLGCVITDGKCSNCARSGIQCPGPSSEDRKWKPRFKEASGKTDQRNWRDALETTGRAVVHTPNEPSAAAPMRTQAFCRFLDVFLADKAATRVGFDHVSFLKLFASRDEANPAYRSALEATSVAHMGAEHNDQDLIKDASLLYRGALAQLNKTLTQGPANEDTLAASMLLQICEFAPSAGNNGFAVHTLGQVHMLYTIGPANVAKSPFLFELFLSVRTAEIVVGLLQRKKINLARTEWLPITANMGLVDPWVSGCNVLAQCPELFERLDACLNSREKDPCFPSQPHQASITAVKQLLVKLEGMLAQHDRQFTPHIAPYGPWVVSYSTLRYVQDLPPPSSLEFVYRFANGRMSYVYGNFWWARWSLVSTRETLETMTDQLPPSPLDTTKTKSFCALEIAKSCAFWCQPRFGSAGRITCLAGMKFAAMTFLSEESIDEANWCSSLSDHLLGNTLCQPKLFSMDEESPAPRGDTAER